MDTILGLLSGHLDVAASGLVFVLWEFWLGKTKLLAPNSTMELALELLYKTIGKILGKVDAQPSGASLSDADKAAGLK